MRFMMFVKSNAEIEKGVLPDVKMFAAMDKYNNELKAAGMLIALDGLEASAKGARVIFGGAEPEVIPGPFPHPDGLVAGYWTISAASLDEAVAWAKRVPFAEGVVEVRPIQEVTDFPPEIQAALNQK